MGKRSSQKASSQLLFLAVIFVTAGQLVSIGGAGNEQIIISTYQVDVGLTVNVPINIFNAEKVAGGSINISFSESIIVVENVTEGDFGTPIANINNTKGLVYIAVALATAVGKINATLATVRFRGVNEGIANLTVEKAELNDEEGNTTIPESVGQASIQVIPEFTSFAVMPLFMVATVLAVIVYKLLRNAHASHRN
jgi:hypothetical protein